MEVGRTATSTRQSLRALFDDLLRLAQNRLITQTLSNLFAGAASGTSGSNGTAIPGFGVTASGGFNLSGGVIPAQAGRVLTEQTFFQRAGKLYSAAEGARSTPETIVPLQRDSKGRLGVASSGGGGHTIHIHLSGSMSKQQAWTAGQTVAQQVKAALATAGVHPRGRSGIRP